MASSVVESVHWSPGDGEGCRAGGAVSRRPKAADPPPPEGYPSDDPPWPVVRPTLIIWHRDDCMACNLNKELFARLERHSRSARTQQEFDDVRVQATPARIQRFPHVTALPTYDLVYTRAGATSAYGPGTELRSVPNNARGPLQEEFPGAFATVAAPLTAH